MWGLARLMCRYELNKQVCHNARSKWTLLVCEMLMTLNDQLRKMLLIWGHSNTLVNTSVNSVDNALGSGL